jgi:hypothetical protein
MWMIVDCYVCPTTQGGEKEGGCVCVCVRERERERERERKGEVDEMLVMTMPREEGRSVA